MIGKLWAHNVPRVKVLNEVSIFAWSWCDPPFISLLSSFPACILSSQPPPHATSSHWHLRDPLTSRQQALDLTHSSAEQCVTRSESSVSKSTWSVLLSDAPVEASGWDDQGKVFVWWDGRFFFLFDWLSKLTLFRLYPFSLTFLGGINFVLLWKLPGGVGGAVVRVVGWVSDNVLLTAMLVVLLLCFVSFTYEMKNKEIMMISQFIGKGLQLLFQKGRTNWKTNNLD